MPFDILTRLSLTAKIATIIVLANFAGLAVTSYFSWTAETAAALETAYLNWQRNAQQIGEIAEGGVKWKKAAAIREAYSLYRSTPLQGMAHFEAINGKGETVDSWTVDGEDTALLTSIAVKTIKAVSEEPVWDKTAGDFVALALPLGKDKAGQPIGYIATVWSTKLIYAESNMKSLEFLAKQAVVITLVICAFLIAMRRNVGKPLAKLSARIAAFQKGDFESPVAFLEKRDEIGVIARALDASLKEAGAKLGQEKIAAAQRDALDAERVRFSEQAGEAARNQAEIVARIGRALEQLAEGDFAIRLPDLGPDFEKLRTDFHKMIESVSETVREIGGATIAVDSGTSELARAADDLAKRTETQAASLGETASALDQITVTVRSSSARAEDAGRMVAEAKTGAHNSAVVVREAIGAMNKIQGSSNQIGQIIGVIDEIAFQTNLLALNAGVEAARAGDAGRGFAVVAQEVRELAQRSANAAKEIKQLISASGAEVAAGVSLVNRTGDALGLIEEQISRINDSIAAIVQSSRDQATGLLEINTSINRMDQVTQQNAAMVEETNAACHELTAQSSLLKRAVSHLRIDDLAEHRQPAATAAASARTELRPANPRQMIRQPTPRGGGGAAFATAQDSWEEF